LFWTPFVALLFEPRDLGVGVYWRRSTAQAALIRRNEQPFDWQFLTVYVCLLPVLPLRLTFRWRAREVGE
jgi:hypothetical protein